MSLCPSCQRVNVPNLMREIENPPSWWGHVGRKSAPRGMVHHESAKLLPASAAAGCRLCGLIVQALLQDIDSIEEIQTSTDPKQPSIDNLQPRLASQPIYLRPNYDPVKASFPGDGAHGAWHVRGFKAFVPVDRGVLTARLRLYAAAGVRGEIIGRHPLSASDSPEAYDLIERWMSACLAKHQACRETLSGSTIDEATPPVLPTRVVDVGSPGRGSPPRVVETHGMRAHYWGPASHHPPMTTQSTLADRLVGIPWETLPRTFQDAMSATRRLGFQYLWIDSLCIIQDSHTDWLGESKRMGDVYQHARLTIAASHAANSTQSCFFTRPPSPPSVELLHVTATGEADGAITATLLPADFAEISPDEGALAYRAWATQEWLLSRRMVFYTAGCIAWSCKVVSQRETGASFHATARNARWKNLVEKYSARLLTRQTDRLIALDGVKSALAAKRPDDTYCLGLWKNSMPDQLLWYCLQPAERRSGELELPTWTWASTCHGIRFLDIKGAKNACTGFRFDETTSSLIFRGAARKAARLSRFTPSTMSVLPFETLLYETVPGNMIYALHAEDDVVVGACVLDEGVVPDYEVLCLRLMSRISTSHSADSRSAEKASEEWVLCLRRINHQADADVHEYERVGVGKILTAVPWFEGQQVEYFDLK